MSSHGKRYVEARGAVNREELYSPVQAVRLLKEAPAAKFDETIEVHMNLGLNVRHADEQLRGTMMLPHGTGRTARVAVFADGDKAREAEEAGADIVGSADLAKRIEEGFTDFDVAVATPDQMGNVGRLGRILGPRGLMPNPKTGTVTFDVAKAVREAKAGKLEYRTDRGANVHIAIGKRSFDERQLVENYAALLDEIVRAKPVRLEGAVHQEDHAQLHDGPGHPRRPDADPRHRGRARRRGRGGHDRVVHGRITPVRQRQEAAQVRSRTGAEALPRRPPGSTFSSCESACACRCGLDVIRGGGSAEGRQGTRGRRVDGEAPSVGDPDRRRLPRADHAADRRAPGQADRAWRPAERREEHAHAPGRRGRRRRRAARAARGAVRDRVHRGRRRSRRRGQGARPVGARHQGARDPRWRACRAARSRARTSRSSRSCRRSTCCAARCSPRSSLRSPSSSRS